MSIPTALLPTTCNIYRPFGAGAPTHTNVPCRLVPDLARGRTPNGTSLSWTHYLVLDVTADVLDAVTRPAGSQLLTYSDGDEIRVPSGATTGPGTNGPRSCRRHRTCATVGPSTDAVPV